MIRIQLANIQHFHAIIQVSAISIMNRIPMMPLPCKKYNTNDIISHWFIHIYVHAKSSNHNQTKRLYAIGFLGYSSLLSGFFSSTFNQIDWIAAQNWLFVVAKEAVKKIYEKMMPSTFSYWLKFWLRTKSAVDSLTQISNTIRSKFSCWH